MARASARRCGVTAVSCGRRCSAKSTLRRGRSGPRRCGLRQRGVPGAAELLRQAVAEEHAEAVHHPFAAKRGAVVRAFVEDQVGIVVDAQPPVRQREEDRAVPGHLDRQRVGVGEQVGAARSRTDQRGAAAPVGIEPPTERRVARRQRPRIDVRQLAHQQHRRRRADIAGRDGVDGPHCVDPGADPRLAKVATWCARRRVLIPCVTHEPPRASAASAPRGSRTSPTVASSRRRRRPDKTHATSCRALRRTVARQGPTTRRVQFVHGGGPTVHGGRTVSLVIPNAVRDLGTARRRDPSLICQ